MKTPRKSLKPTKNLKVPVSERAIIQRINRKLAPDGERVKACREGRWIHDLGRYYLVAGLLHSNQGGIARTDLDLGAFAREVGVLKPWEEVVES